MAEINKFLSDDAEKQVKNLVTLMNQLAKSYEANFQASKKLDDQLKAVSKTTENTAKTKKKITEAQKEENRILAASEKTKAKLLIIEGKSDKLLQEQNKELIKNQELLKAKTKEEREAAKAVLNSKNAYDKLSRELNETRKAYKNLAASGKANTKEAKAQLATIRRLDSQLKKIDNSVGQNQRSVGKYSDALKGMTARFIGWGAAIAIVGRGLVDAFSRIRQYDKAIVELSGVLRVSRKDLSDLEDLIISVASSSTKTSTEVAQLASVLATLGKSKDEIKNLLKPTNDLSISLKATSEEAGELLVGTLNAFQESSKEAKRYADVIANMRISTALDFERIKDSLGFVAPTAKAVGLTIEGLGARIGVLVNNSVKASRAGRLLNSSFARLIKQGLTLEKALDLINESTDKAKTASELFGTESFSLALILASNRDKVDELTTAYENSQGVLDELTKRQLTSLDAKLKILDSSWEALIFTITKGDNVISKFIAGTIDLFSGGLRFMSDSISGADNRLETFAENINDLTIEEKAGEFKKLSDEAVRLIRIQDRMNLSTEEFLKLSAVERSEVRLARREKEQLQTELDLILDKMQLLNPATKENTELIEDNTEATEDNEKALKKAAQTRQDALKDWIKLNNELKRTNAGLSQFEILTKEQETLLKFTESIFGKSTIDEDAKDFLKKTGDTLDELGELQKQKREEQDKADLDAQEEKEAKRRQIIEAADQLLSESLTAFSDLKIQQLSDESNAIELQRQTALENVKGDKAKEEQINAQFDRKQAAIKEKQWKVEQQAALTQIIINTAVGVAKAWGQTGIFGIAAQIPVLIMGALQAGIVLAQKPPKFAKGSKGLAKDTYGEVGDAGRELLFMPGGGAALAEKPTKAFMPKGTVIKTNRETEQILAANQLKASRENDILARDYTELKLLSQSIAEDRKSVLEAVKDRDQYVFEVSKDGVKALMKNKRGITTYLDNRFR